MRRDRNNEPIEPQETDKNVESGQIIRIDCDCALTIDTVAQAPATPKQAARKGTAAQKTKELSTQIESLQSKLDQAQTQIQQQKVQIEQLQQSLQESVNALHQQQQQLQDTGGVCDHRHLLLDP